MSRGVYVRRLHMAGADGADGAVVVEQRIFAHRVRKHLLVTEFELIDGEFLQELMQELIT